MIKLSKEDVSDDFSGHTYNIIQDDNNVGYCQLRDNPSKSKNMPNNFESHIYYEIKEEYRNRGYASEALNLLIKEAKNLNIGNLTITAKDSNISSIRVIEKNNGILQHKDYSKDDVLYRKYLVFTN
jgi:predicted acetyltransferase